MHGHDLNRRVSSPPLLIDLINVNTCCHAWTGGVQPNSKHVIRSPRVFLIFWGHLYQTNSDYTTFGYALVRDLVTGTFMNNLCQYGVAVGSLTGSATIDTNTLAPAPDTLDQPGVAAQLKQWIDNEVIPAPAVNEESAQYFILPPPETQLTYGSLSGDTDFCGYHFWDQYNSKSTQPDLFYAIISTKGAAKKNKIAKDFISAISPCVSHELAESFTNRDGFGYVSNACTNPDKSTNTCEIADICEDRDTFAYPDSSGNMWNVEQYWSQWDNACVNGNNPVSVKHFLDAIGFDYKTQGLRGLGTELLNIPFMASRIS